MGSPPQPPTPSSFSPSGASVTLPAAAPPGRDGSTADSFPFDDNRDEKQKEGIIKQKHIKDNFAAAFTKERVEICRTGWLASFASSPTNPGGVAVSETSLLLDSGASFHAVGDVSLLTDPVLFPTEVRGVVVLPDGTDLRIGGTGPLQMDGRFSIPDVPYVDGLKTNLISVSQLDKDHGLCCCFHSKKCEVMLTDGTVVGGAILRGDGMYGSTADSFPFDDNRDEKQKEGILKIIKISDVVSEKAAQHDETCLAQVEEEDGHLTLPRPFQDFLSVLKGRAREGRSEHNHLDLILDSGASMHATGNLGLLSEFTRAPGGSSAAVYHTRDGKDLRIAGVGMIACDKFHLPHVHYVPELGSRFTLASVQLLAGCDYLVMFSGGWCYVKNRNNGSLVGRGRMHDEDGLYHLEYLRIPLVLVDGAN